MKNRRLFSSDSYFISILMLLLVSSANAKSPPQKLSTYQQGVLLLKAGKTAEAKTQFEDYVSESPAKGALGQQQAAQKLYDVANAYSSFKLWGKAAQYFEQVTKQLPTNYQAWLEYGLALFEDGKFEPAIDALKSSVENAGRNSRPFVVLANVYEKRGNRYEARSVYNDMAKKKVETAFAYSRLCHSFAVESYFDDAMKYCDMAVEADPKDMNSLVTLGKMMFEKGSKQAGLFKLAKAAAVFSNEAMPYRVRGWIYLSEGNNLLARKDLGRALALDPSDGESAVGLAEALFDSGLYDQAMIAFTEASHIDKKFSQEFARRQRMLSIKRDPAAAKYSERLSKL